MVAGGGWPISCFAFVVCQDDVDSNIIISFLTSTPALEEKKALKIREEEHTERYGVMIYCLCHIFFVERKVLVVTGPTPPLLISMHTSNLRKSWVFSFQGHKWVLFAHQHMRQRWNWVVCTNSSVHPNRMTQYCRL